MTDDRDQGSVLMLLPDEDERALLEHVQQRLRVDPAHRERLLARLERIDDRAIQRARREARQRTALRAVALAATLALAVLGGRVAYRSLFGAPAELPPTMVVITAAGQTQAITPVSGIDVEVRPGTEVTVLPGDPGVRLVLADGEVVVDYRRGPAGPPLQVAAGDVDVRVTGTRFGVSRSGDQVEVWVDRGSVAVAWPGGEADLAAGGTWRSRPVEDAVADGAPPVSAVEPSVPPADVSPASPVVATPPAITAPPAAPGPAPSPAAEVAAGEPVALAAAAPPVEDEAALFARIQLERGAGVPAADRLLDLEAFLAAYPDGPFAEEVRALHVEALADTGQDRAALDAAAAFCERHGEGTRRRQVRWIEARVAHHRLGDCARALPAYRELAAGTGPRVGDAMYGLGVCAYETGRLDEARDALGAATAFELDAAEAEHARRLLDAMQ